MELVVLTAFRLLYGRQLRDMMALDRVTHASATEEKKHKFRKKVVVFGWHVSAVEDPIMSKLNRAPTKLETTHRW
ncbi:hypothetical protein D3C87_1549930 [compost metagenome]